MNFLKVAVALALPVSGALAQINPPGGRLTLVSNTPVMTSDVTGTGTVYYTPYVGNSIPVANGTTVSANTSFSQLTLTLTSALTANTIHDVFVFQSAGLIICAGPAWSSSSSRGTGTGTTELTQINGIWVNANTISTCVNSAGGVCPCSVIAKDGVYLGSIYMTANGATSMQFKPTAAAGGTANILGVYNAYNRVRTVSRSIDSTSSWAVTSPTWATLDAGAASPNNTISFLDGWPQAGASFVDAEVQVQMATSSSSVCGAVGVGLDGASPSTEIGLTYDTSQITIRGFEHYTPQIGFHTVSAQQYASGSTVTFSTNSGTAEGLKVELEM